MNIRIGRLLPKKALMLFFVVLGLVAFPYSSTCNVEVHASQASESLKGVDFFIVIDQTSSMNQNDPQDLRIATANYLVDYAAFYATSHPEETSRISIIDIGSLPEEVPLTSLPVTKLLDQDPILLDLKKLIVAKNLGETNLVFSLDSVEDELVSANDFGAERQRVIFLVTDGNLGYNAPGGASDLKTNFDELQTRYQSLLEKQPGKWDFFVFGIYPQSIYWSDIVGPYWREIATSASEIKQIDDVKTEVAKNISPLLGYSDRLYAASEGMLIEPYLESVRFFISKHFSSDELAVEYEDAAGNIQTVNLDAENITRLLSANFEIITVKKPQTGVWRIVSSSNQKLDIYKENEAGQVNLIFPTKSVPVNIPFYFQFDVAQYEFSNTEYPLIWNVKLIEPNSNILELEVSNTANDSVFRTSQPFTPAQIGSYEVLLELSTRYDEKSSPVLLYSSKFDFSVFDVVYRFDPAPPYLQYEPIENLTLYLTDSNDIPIDIDPNAKFDLFLRLHLPTGEIKTYPFSRVNTTYRIMEPLLLQGDGEKSFDILAIDEFDRELFSKTFPIEAVLNIKLISPAAQVPQNSMLSLVELKLLDSNNVEYIPSSGLRIDVTIIPTANENPVSVSLEYDSTRDSYVAEIPSIPANTLGKKVVRVVGTVNIDDKEYQLFEDELFYSVVTDLPYFRVISPSFDKMEYPLYEGMQKVGVPIQIQWVKGNLPIDPTTEFINEPSNLILVDVLKADKVILSDVVLSQLSSSDSSIWGTTLSDLNTAGNYTVVFKMQEAILISQQPYMDFEPLKVQFTLVEDALQRWFRLGGIFVAVILVSIVGGREVRERKGPYPKGVLTIIEHNMGSETKIGELVLTGYKRRTKRWRFPDKSTKNLGITQLLIRHAVGRRGSQTEGIYVEALDEKGTRLFTMQFDRGMTEKRIPQKDKTTQLYYGIAYSPPAAYGNKAILPPHK